MTALDEVTRLGGVDEYDPPVATPRIRLLVVDDHAAVRRGLWELFDDQDDFRVVGTAPSAERAMAVAERDQFDVAVVDYQLGDRNGLWLSRKLKRLPRPPRVVIYSAYCDGLLAAAAAVAEVDGLVSKASLGSELCDSIRSVARGRASLPAVPWQVAATLRCRLDDAEQAIFGMSLAGLERAEIARILGLSEAALESRVGQMLRKLETIDHASWERSTIVD
ncbi:MAG TPA: response regulator transcription factor [Solirubrobacteraceae bacterium]|nr:response regulator transcription factor [Solirubrobacteraceae bacterium]